MLNILEHFLTVAATSKIMRTLSTIILALLLGISAAAQQQLKVGSQAPDFNGESINGQEVSLSQLHGKVVVLTFWSTRCEICHSEIPKLNRIRERYKGKDVVFLALTMENNTRVEPYLKKTPFNFDIVTNSLGIVLKYADMDKSGNINLGFPSYFVINQDGAITLKADGWDKTENLEAQITRLLAAE